MSFFCIIFLIKTTNHGFEHSPLTPPPLRTLQVMLLGPMAACLKLWITLPFALESFRFAPANPDCWQRGSEDFCCDPEMKVSTLGTGIIWYFFWGRIFLLKPFTRWWQLKYFYFQPELWGRWTHFVKGVETNNQFKIRTIFMFLILNVSWTSKSAKDKLQRRGVWKQRSTNQCCWWLILWAYPHWN